jgi:hypothetical protein
MNLLKEIFIKSPLKRTLMWSINIDDGERREAALVVRYGGNNITRGWIEMNGSDLDRGVPRDKATVFAP